METVGQHPDPTAAEVDIFAIERPHRNLLTYYLMAALITGPAFPFVALPLYFRYHTMRYRFTDEGVSMRWGVLFRREINLTYARIQDIHLTSNLVERWLGLARIQIQTASGSAKAEMTIEGVPQFEALRDFLYLRMRGAKGLESPPRPRPAGDHPVVDGAVTDEIVAALRETTAELRAIRELMGTRSGRPSDG
jgi:putative membrane protein